MDCKAGIHYGSAVVYANRRLAGGNEYFVREASQLECNGLWL